MSSHKSWETTIVGSARVERTQLRLEANSVRRADELRGRVETSCAGLLTFQTREHNDPQALLASGKVQKPRGSPPANENGSAECAEPFTGITGS